MGLIQNNPFLPLRVSASSCSHPLLALVSKGQEWYSDVDLTYGSAASTPAQPMLLFKHLALYVNSRVLAQLGRGWVYNLWYWTQL